MAAHGSLAPSPNGQRSSAWRRSRDELGTQTPAGSSCDDASPPIDPAGQLRPRLLPTIAARSLLRRIYGGSSNLATDRNVDPKAVELVSLFAPPSFDHRRVIHLTGPSRPKRTCHVLRPFLVIELVYEWTLQLLAGH